MAKVLVATPAYDGKVHSIYAQSLLVAGQHCARNGIEVASTLIGNAHFLDVARNIAVMQCLADEYEYLFFIDGDVGFEPDYVTQLVKATKQLPVTAGVMRQRDTREHYVMTLGEREQGGWLEVKRVGCAFMCIRRDVLELLTERAQKANVRWHPEPVPFVFKTEASDVFIGEDTWFCDRYRELYDEGVVEHPIWLWPDMTLNHAGFIGNFADARERNRMQAGE